MTIDMRPQTDDYPDHIEPAVAAAAEGRIEEGARLLQPIASPPLELPKRKPLSRELMVLVFRRDSFCCKYCRGKTILTPVMELLGGLYPELFPFQSAGWKAGITHPAIISRSPAVDHVLPAAWGGSNDLENLVTACTPCNSIKSDMSLEQIGWEVVEVAHPGWDGLSRYYESLWKAAGRSKPEYHSAWLRLLNQERGLHSL